MAIPTYHATAADVESEQTLLTKAPAHPWKRLHAGAGADAVASDPVRQAVQRRQGLQREGRLLREHVPCQRHPLRRPLCQAGLGV